ncbi:hypothetical protein N7466_006785 [Penicillium verhagenii]|uniref:uncharacterized protein n=1 Tax=Penicillium verhagenii TaxID=1562060 RepID=UPI00254511A2|nr:uncharacterized protein N7466_006785 [Penicillium verhagenii]KAJ5927829.1 hypothetical protein N7466_006785 [Penicillium verhagenii]
MAEPISNAAEAKLEIEPSTENIKIANGTPPPVPEVAVKDPANIPIPSESPKKGCKHTDKMDNIKKKKRRTKKKAVDETSDSESSSSSSDDTDSDTSVVDSVTDESELERRKKTRYRKAKQALRDKKKRQRRRQRGRKSAAVDPVTETSSESDTGSESYESDSALDEKNLRHLVAKLTLKKRHKRSRDQNSDETGSTVTPTETRRSRRSKRKPASKVDFKRVDQLWDSTIHKYKLTETVNDPDADEWDQYLFTVRRKFNWENKYLETVVDIKSKPLREAMTKVMDGVKGVSMVEDPAVVDPNMLFLYLDETRQHMKDLKEKSRTGKKRKERKSAATQAAHLKVLLKYLDSDYASVKKTLYPLLENNTITFDLLWAIFKPNSIAYTPTYGNTDEPRAFKIEYAQKESSFVRGQWYDIEGRYLEYDGKDFGFGTMSAEVESFKGPRKITSLACYPLQYHRDAEGLQTRLVERGKRFVAMRGMNYRFHKGMAFYKRKKNQIAKVNIDSRVMVDPALHRRVNPNYAISTVRPKDSDLFDAFGTDMTGDEDDSDNGCCCAGSDSDTGHGGMSDVPRTRYKVIEGDDGTHRVVEVEVDENGQEVQKENLERIEGTDGVIGREFTEEELLIASPVVLGFAFTEKMWLEFTISGISDIEWDKEAFDSLVLPDNQKSIVKALVESHTFHAAENIDDVIQGKGKGLVAVLHGPPGTGKTLTAEGIAELLKRPLYMVSAGELGTDSRTLEAELNKILDIAHSWGAVLLLDEADIFLEKRTIHDIHRNALVSIFLRLLEYFQGILFLTTNRVETFDDAFQSRIHVALRYGDLAPKAKRSIWKMFLERVRAIEGVQTAEFTEKDYDLLSRHTLNGRQIKNSVRTAQALAVNERMPLSMDHIKRVLDVAETFDHDLRGGTGYLDAMRSYT